MTLEELQTKLELWKGAWPELVRGALKEGTDVIAGAIRMDYRGRVLSPGFGKGQHLYSSVRTSVSLNPLKARVYVDGRQQYKAQTHEHGKTIEAKKAEWMTFKVDGHFVKVKSVTVPQRAIFEPELKAKHQMVLSLIHDKILEGYKGQSFITRLVNSDV